MREGSALESASVSERLDLLLIHNYNTVVLSERLLFVENCITLFQGIPRGHRFTTDNVGRRGAEGVGFEGKYEKKSRTTA